MGTNQSTIFQQGQPLSNYDIVQKVPQHSISYLKHKITNRQYLIKQFAINDKTEFAQLSQKMKNRKKIESNYLTKLERYSEQLEDHLCSQFYKLFAMWEYPSHTLEDQIKERALMKRRFHQNQLFSIIACVIQGMSCLQQNGIKHECLTSTSVLFDESGALKIADPLTCIFATNFQRLNTNRKIKTIYIAPQQCESLKNQRPIPNRNVYKSDVFVLGVTLLECGLLQRMDNLYIQEFQEIDLDQLHKRLQQFSRVYSRDLRLTVETMLTRDPKERMDWIGLKQYIPQKKDQTQKHSNKTFNTISSVQRFQTLNDNKISQQPLLSNRVQIPNNYPKTSFQSRFTYSSNPINPVPVPTQFPVHFNSNLGQPTQSFTYQRNQSQAVNNYVPLSNFMPSTMIENKHNFQTQRPTEDYTFPAFSKLSTLQKQSSFPLTSKVQYKKDYQINQPYMTSQQGYKPENQFNSQLAPITSFLPSNTNYSVNPTQHYVIPQPLSSKNQVKYDKSNLDFTANSPFLSNYVKDTKSITYQKNISNSSFMDNDKSIHQNALFNNNYQTQRYQPNQNYNKNAQLNNHQASNGYTHNQFFNIYAKKQASNSYGNNFESSSRKQTSKFFGNNTTQISSKEIVNNVTQSSSKLVGSNIIQSKNLVVSNPSLVPSSTSIANANGSSYQRYQYKQISSIPKLSQNSVASSNQKQPPQMVNKEQNYRNEQIELQYVVQHFKQGSRYQGTKYQDMRHGQGKFFYQDGGMYDGNWKFNKMDGFGKLYYQSGKIAYEGNWKDDQFQAHGKLYNEQPDLLDQLYDYENFDLIQQYWVYYQGNFLQDQKDGQGKMMFSNQQFFVGHFHRDMVDGPGEFHTKNGQIIRGVWSQNQMVEQQE